MNLSDGCLTVSVKSVNTLRLQNTRCSLCLDNDVINLCYGMLPLFI